MPAIKHRYLLIDGNALVHRAYHAIPNLQTRSGQPTGAIFGFLTIFLKAIKDLKATHVAATFDLAGPTFRHEKYKEYKATRVKADQALYDQIPIIKNILRAMNVPIYEKEGYEADDVLGTLACKIRDERLKVKDVPFEIFILTGDMDTLQLVNEVTKIYTSRKGLTDTTIYDSKAVRERFGLLPSQMVDYKALRGDPSDNIPGVRGVGEKTASGLIQQFKTLDGLYQAIKSKNKEVSSKIKPRILDLLVEQEEQARMSYELSTIVCNVPGIDQEIKPYQLDSEHLAQTVKLFQGLEFRSLLGKLPKTEARVGEGADLPQEIREADGLPYTSDDSQKTSIGKQDYIFVDTPEKLELAIKELSKASEIVIDTETTGLDPITAELVGVGLCAKAGRAFYVPKDLFLSSVELKNLLSSGKHKLIGHNIKYDKQVLTTYNLQLKSDFDTMIASYLLNAGSRQHGLDALAFNELGYQMQPIEDLIGKGKGQITMDKVEPEKVSWYCCEDVDMTFRLKELYAPELQKNQLTKVFNEIEMPLVEVLADVELNGIKLDVKLLNRLAGEAEINIKDSERAIYKLAGREFNINSPKQLKEILFDELKLEAINNKRTKTGVSTSADNLEKMLGQHAIIPKILEYREVTKLYSTYLTTLPVMVNKKTRRLHTSYNQTIAATGRLSSVDPNLQNIPVKGDGLGSQVRKAFVAEKGYKLLSLDYSQIELRIVAHLAQDKKMMEVFKNNEDIHSKTAMEIFGVPASAVTKDMRRDAKTINFGILYGVSSFGLSSRVGEMTMGDAKQYIKKYFEAYPQVEEYIEQVKLQVNQEGFVRNELGRIRKFPEIKSSQFFIRAAAERAAVNFPIQSLAADVIKVAMINIYKLISGLADKLISSDIRMLLQVHDELVFEVREDKVEEWAKKLIPLMENAIKLSVPVKVEAKVGENWGEIEKLELRS